jgi:hypothetical protein
MLIASIPLRPSLFQSKPGKVLIRREADPVSDFDIMPKRFSIV